MLERRSGVLTMCENDTHDGDGGVGGGNALNPRLERERRETFPSSRSSVRSPIALRQILPRDYSRFVQHLLIFLSEFSRFRVIKVLS